MRSLPKTQGIPGTRRFRGCFSLPRAAAIPQRENMIFSLLNMRVSTHAPNAA